MHKQAIIVDKTLLLILFFKFSFKEKKVERSVVIMQIKIIIEEAQPANSLIVNARKTNGSSANNNELSLINNAIIINTIMAPKMLEHNIANFFAFFSFILLPIEIKILLETIILQLEYKIIEAVKNAKFVASKENVIAE